MDESNKSGVIILANGPVGDYPSLARLIKQKDKIVCVDGGLKHAETLGLTPDVVLGDMDSVNREQLNALSDSVEIHRYPAEKNETDLELAMDRVTGRGYERILIAGVSGGRIDHTLANILLITRYVHREVVCFWEQGQMAWVVNGAREVCLDQYNGHTVSLLPLSDRVAGVTTWGLKYPLDSEELVFGTTRGISNIVEKALAGVSVSSGCLLVIATEPSLA